jgi:thiamine biosynthesis lipoprotein
MSFHAPDSDVSRLNRARADEETVVHGWTYAVLEAGAQLHRASNGSFNVAVAPALQCLGLLPCSGRQASITPALASRDAFELRSENRVRKREAGSKIDLGGIAKGFAVDRAIEVLQRHGVPNGLVNAGGDLAAFGPDAHVVAIRDPRDPARLMCRAEVRAAAMASSGLPFDPVTSEKRLHSAIIDPQSGQPASAIVGATVRAPTCMIADALTKVVMIAGVASSQTLDHYGASALLVTANDEVHATPDWQGAFSIAA